MKNQYLIIIGLLLFSCTTKLEDPLKGFKLGETESSWKNNIKKLLADGRINDKVEGEETYRTSLINGLDSIKANITLNDDRYYFGKLRTVKFDLRGNTISNWNGDKNFDSSEGPVKKESVDKLLNWFIKFYGMPNDTVEYNIPKYNSGFSTIISRLKKNIELFNSIYDIKPKEGAYIWLKNNYEIEFFIGKTKKYFGDTTTNNYSDTYIKFRSKNFEQEVKKISDSIRRQLTPNEILKLDLSNFQWKNIEKNYYYENDTEFSINIGNILVKSREELRRVIGFRMDIVIYDIFNDEICRFKDLKVELNEPIKFQNSMLVWTTGANNFTFTMKYNKNNSSSREYERARKKEYSKIKIIPVIKAIVFEDGSGTIL